MHSADAIIEQGKFDIAYEIAFIPTTSKNTIVPHHKWFTDDELILKTK